jgi:hypothetical protein
MPLNKNLLAIKSLGFGLKILFTSPIQSLSQLWDSIITPLANEQLAREERIPPELKNAYARIWTYDTISDVRRESALKRWNAKSMQN